VHEKMAQNGKVLVPFFMALLLKATIWDSVAKSKQLFVHG
jgi:hypothetical protein